VSHLTAYAMQFNFHIAGISHRVTRNVPPPAVMSNYYYGNQLIYV